MTDERPRIGPKAAEDEVPLATRGGGPRGLAMRAVDISPTDRAHVYRAIRQRLFSRPLEFVWPPRDEPRAALPGEAR